MASSKQCISGTVILMPRDWIEIAPRTAWVFILLLLFRLFLSTAAGAAQEKVAPAKADTADVHLGKGYEAEKDERYQVAAQEFQAALALEPGLSRARYQLAVCWYALGKTAEARAEFDRVAKETGGNPSVRYYLALLDLREGKVDAAIAGLAPLMQSPPFADTAYYLGAAYLEKGDLKQAERWLRRAAAADPQDYRVPDHLARVYQREGRKEEAEKQFALTSEMRQRLDDASRQAVACSQLLESKPLEEAQPACQQLFDASDPARLTTLGMIYGQHGYFDQALAPLLEASRLDPDSSEISHDLGLTYFRLRRYAEARAALEKAVALRPDFFGSNAILGATLYALGEDEACYKVLLHAHALNPGDLDTADLLFKEAVILADKEEAQHNDGLALAHLKTAAQVHPDDERVQQRLAALAERATHPPSK
jgi:tetratricopeptide (TPR) repeat protein